MSTSEPPREDEPNWPATDHEKLRWNPKVLAIPSSRVERENQFRTYDAAIPPAIENAAVEIDARTLAAAEDAANEITRFDIEMGSEIAPFSSILLRSESASSSQIEHLTSSARNIALAEIGGSAGRNADEIVSNTRAMTAAIELSNDLSADSILAMHNALMAEHHADIAGRWRDAPVWIGGSNTPHNAVFVPPQAERVPQAMADLVRFSRRNDIPILTHAAIAHAQFETIHPFPDGNGRTGRAYLHAMLRNKRLTRQVTVPLSAGLLTDTRAYEAALTEYRAGYATPIVQCMTDASFRAIGNGRVLAADITDIRCRWQDTLSARSDSQIWQVATTLTKQPVVNSRYLQDQLGITETTSLRLLGSLEQAGILTEFSGGKRNRCWRSDEVCAALDAFASRTGRRVY